MTPVRPALDVTLAAAGLGLCVAIGLASPGVEAADVPIAAAAAAKASAPRGELRVAPPAPAASKVRATSHGPAAARRASAPLAAASRPIDGMKWDALDPKTVPPVPDAPPPAPNAPPRR